MLVAEAEEVVEEFTVEGAVAVSAALKGWEDVVGRFEALLPGAADSCWCGLDKECCWRGLEEANCFWRGLVDCTACWRGLGRLDCCWELVDPVVDLPMLRT